ncbi:hypothetical protein MHBO_001718 [Bonamia ostreae]|uniref:Uncharacterized protein n=1 Tax=Bonamia ostreae TaxID=126728 RepID=A0ABV2AJY4_9EUKA
MDYCVHAISVLISLLPEIKLNVNGKITKIKELAKMNKIGDIKIKEIKISEFLANSSEKVVFVEESQFQNLFSNRTNRKVYTDEGCELLNLLESAKSPKTKMFKNFSGLKRVFEKNKKRLSDLVREDIPVMFTFKETLLAIPSKTPVAPNKKKFEQQRVTRSRIKATAKEEQIIVLDDQETPEINKNLFAARKSRDKISKKMALAYFKKTLSAILIYKDKENFSEKRKIVDAPEHKLKMAKISGRERQKTLIASKINISELIEECDKTRFGYSKDCCGCKCHKILVHLEINGRDISCRFCAESHKNECFIFRFVLTCLFKRIQKHIESSSRNFYETQNVLCLFINFSNMIFLVKEHMIKYKLLTRTVKKDTSKLVEKIFSLFFLSFNIDVSDFIDLKTLHRAWKEFLGEEKLVLPEEGWFGKKIERVLARKTFSIEEPPKIYKQRIRALVAQNRVVDALVYSCAVNDIYCAAKCLALLGRIAEAQKCLLALPNLHKDDTIDFTKLFFAHDPKTALKFYSLRRVGSKQPPLQVSEIEWLCKSCTESKAKNGFEKDVIALIKELCASLPPTKAADLKQIAAKLRKFNFSAVEIAIEQSFRKDRKSEERDSVWLIELILNYGADAKNIESFIKNFELVSDYDVSFAAKTTRICEMFVAKEVFWAAEKLGICFLRLYSKHFQRQNKKSAIAYNNYLRSDHKDLVGSVVGYMFKNGKRDNVGESDGADIEDLGQRLKKFLELVFVIKIPDLLFAVFIVVWKIKFSR